MLTVGLDNPRVGYFVEEREGSLRVCAQITGEEVIDDISVTISTVDGTAKGML